MEIRQATMEDLTAILKIYERARVFMAEQGNPTQWGTTWPPESAVLEDIATGTGYVAVESGEILGVCHYRFGEDTDPTYRDIDGAWKRDGAYGVIHRIAAKRSGTGAGEVLIRWAIGRSGHLRIDTHEDNLPMRKLLKKLGFVHCGIITVRDGSKRMAFEI